jgi:hypothetical protein
LHQRQLTGGNIGRVSSLYFEDWQALSTLRFRSWRILGSASAIEELQTGGSFTTIIRAPVQGRNGNSGAVEELSWL